MSAVSRFVSQARRAAVQAKVVSQITSRVFMIEPNCFNYNAQTAVDNAFQGEIAGLSCEDVRSRAMHEFVQLAEKLTLAGIEVNRIKDTRQKSEDAVFPNNWISFHDEVDGRCQMVLYPMMSERRRLERRDDVVSEWKDRLNATVIDYSKYENEGKFLEGTGSMVLDRVNRLAYACESKRTNKDLFERFCRDLGYTPVLFESFSRDKDGLWRTCPIYHTNVMMSIGTTFAVVCLESIDATNREKVEASLKESYKTVIPISIGQVAQYAGNVLQVMSKDKKSYLVMSSKAHDSYTADQKETILRHVDGIIHSPLDTIETLGGGGARCMLAEVFPPNII